MTRYLCVQPARISYHRGAMFTKNQFQTLYAYRAHTTRRLLERAAQLSEADYKAHPGYGRGSIHDLFFHQLNTDRGWRTALETGTQPPPLQASDYTDLTSIQACFEQEQAAWRAYLDGLAPEQYEGDVALTTRRGDTASVPRWRVLQHLILHGMQHHTEIAQLLTARGQSPGDIDFIFYNG
jgi:uncharacterized damage-inducible protein DinB